MVREAMGIHLSDVWLKQCQHCGLGVASVSPVDRGMLYHHLSALFRNRERIPMPVALSFAL